MKRKEKQTRDGTKRRLRDRLADWVISPGGKWRQKIKIEQRQEFRKIILDPVSWFKGVDLPEGHITPWELFLYALSAALSNITSGFAGRQDFLFKEYYKIAPNKISVGQKIKIPGSSGGTRDYTVKSGDSLWAIAAREIGNGNRYKEIKSLNGLSGNTIYVGQTLKLPE